MKYFLTLLTLSLLIFSGCKPENIQEPDPINKGVIIVTATLPSSQQDAADINLSWQPGDKLDLLLVDGTNKIKQTVSISNIQDNGKKADFSVDLSEIKGSSFDLYGIYGGEGLLTRDPSKASLPFSNKSIGATLSELQNNKVVMLRFSKTNNDAKTSAPLSVNFEHIGSVFSVQLTNGGTSELNNVKKARISSATSDLLGVHIITGPATYDVISGKIVGTTTAASLTFETPIAQNIAVNESFNLWGWYIPNGTKWPEVKIEGVNTSGIIIRTIIYNVDKNKQADVPGRAFHFRAYVYDPGIPNMKAAVDLAIRLSYPIYGDGSKDDPRAFVVNNDREEASPEYRQEKLRAIDIAKSVGNPYLPEDGLKRYAHCSQFTQTVVVNTIDPFFPHVTQTQIAYVKNESNGWIKVGGSENYNPSDYKAGDIFLTKIPGHTFMWIGEYQGYPDIVADSSISGKLPTLIRSRINKDTGLDPSKRLYDIWRFVGRSETGSSINEMYGNFWPNDDEDVQ